MQYQNLSAISKDFVDRTEEEHRDYRGWGDEVGEIYDEYVTVTYYITAKGKQFRREQELKFKKDVDDFVFHVEQRNYTEAQTVLNRLISYQ
ncbi:hypothetical protein [Clostridium sp. AM58-1XD]|uniref:hypothetical protein n=1 Tax=Clostridium sp. AM58-1XD TaxID=2292307 RepID=UPI000E47BA33|nr:hypothetical protein [Clostridium sp. AM58-1XD]RGY99435.1 hypothetical protein DXA13_07960 [Clostridium sp. AM58-1XD]